MVTSRGLPKLKSFQNGAHRSSAFTIAIDGIYNVSTTNTLSTLIQRTILHYLSGFQRKIPVDHLMNLGLDREATAVSRSVDGDPRTLFSSQEMDLC